MQEKQTPTAFNKQDTDYRLSPVFQDDMPTWMRQAEQRVDWGVLLVFAFSILLAWPLVLRPGLLQTNDMTSAVFMAADYANALQEGQLYPRWSAAALLGYGAPIPNYYPPGAPYFAALIDVLFTNDTVVAVKIVYVLALVMAGVGTYAFTLRWAGAKAGLFAAVLYVYSPYVGFTALYATGNLQEMLGLGLLPMTLWAVHRLLTRNRPYDFALVALIFAALCITHPGVAGVSALIAIGLMGWYARTKRRWSRIVAAAMALAFGVAITSFFWVPALAEQHLIRWQPAPYTPDVPGLSLIDLILPMRRIDLNEWVVTPQVKLGLPLMIFTILGGVNLYRERWRRGVVALFAISALVIVVGWLLLFPQETWLFGTMTFCLAIVGSAALRLRKMFSGQYRRLIPPVMLFAALVLAIPVWLPPFWSGTFDSLSLADQIVYEQQGYGVAVLPAGASVPVPVHLPQTLILDRDLVDGYQSGDAVRIPRTQLGSDGQVNLLSSRSHWGRYQVTMNEDVEIVVLRSYFPGWQGVLDGEALTLSPDAETGLIRLVVPETEIEPLEASETDEGRFAPPDSFQILLVRFDGTPTRRVAWAITWGAVGLMVLESLRRLRRRQKLPPELTSLIPNKDSRLLGIIFGVFAVSVLFFANPETALTLHARPGYQLDGTAELRTLTGVGLEALSFDLPKTNYSVGETINFSVSWRTLRPLLLNYRVQVYLEDASNQTRWSQTEMRYLGRFPSRRWQTGFYVLDHYELPIPPTVRPGAYRIVIEVFDCNPDCANASNLGFFDTDANFLGNELVLPSVIQID